MSIQDHVRMLQQCREWLSTVLIVLLPFHAVAVTVLTRAIAGPEHAPLLWIASWKEALLGVILFLAAIEWISSRRRESGLSPAERRTQSFDLSDLCILALLVLGLVVSPLDNLQPTTSSLLLGFKYTLLPLVSFFILRHVLWSDGFLRRVQRMVLCVGAVVAGYGLVTLFLPDAFFMWLGYSGLHSLYVPSGPVAAFQQIGETATRRMQATFSGPNQLGLWLLLPWSIAIVRESRGERTRHMFHVLLLCLFGLAIVLTFSRAAWIAAIIIAVLALWRSAPRAGARLTLLSLGTACLVVAGLVFLFSPQILLRPLSTREHLLRPVAAIRTIAEHPFGLGLGSAGPASNRTNDACVFLEANADASWVATHPSLCVFVGGVQVQPLLDDARSDTNRVCRCPLLPENGYLQVGIELGLPGFFLYLLLILTLLWKLYRQSADTPGASRINMLDHFAIFLIFLGLSFAALFLHSFEDSAVAMTAWLLLAVILPPRAEAVRV